MDARQTSPFGLFRCDPALRIGTIGGPIAERLGCSEADLLEHGWHPFLHKDDWSIIGQMGQALASTRASRYEIRAVAKTGHRLYLAIRTFVVFGAGLPSMGGVIDLLQLETIVRYFDLGA